MDFKELLLVADKNHKQAAKQSQQVKRLSTHFTTPAKKEVKDKPRSEIVQKLLQEREKEKKQAQKEQDRERTRQEKLKQEQERDEKHKNTFRIPKKIVSDQTPSDAESFSSISSEDEMDSNNSILAKFSADLAAQRSSLSSEQTGKSLSRENQGLDKSSLLSSRHRGSHASGQSSSADGHHSKSKHNDNSVSEKHNSSSLIEQKHSSSSEPQRHSSSDKHKHSSSDKHKHSSSDNHKHSSSDKHKHLTLDMHRHSSSDKHKHSSTDSHKHSSSDKHKHSSSDAHKHSSSDKHKHSSSDSHKHSSSDKHKHTTADTHKHKNSSHDKHGNSSNKRKPDSSAKNSKPKVRFQDCGSSEKSESSSHKQHDSDRSEDNDSSGYITSPDLSSEEEGEASSSRPSDLGRRGSTSSKKEENADIPVTLTRHHLKPTVERRGCSLEERNQVLSKLQAIREKMMAEDDAHYSRKRAARGEVKKRRARREKLDGDFSGSCMEKIQYDEEEKPSLKRPEPKPEEIKPEKERKPEKQRKTHSEKRAHKNESERSVNKLSKRHKLKSDYKVLPKFNKADAVKEKPKMKIKHRPRPPPVNFADLLKMAEQKQAQPVMVDIAPKKEKQRRPMTQDEIDRKHAREERVKTKEYKDWYKYGDKSKKVEQSGKKEPKDKEAHSGGFLRRDGNVVPDTSNNHLGPAKASQESSGKSLSVRPDKSHSSTAVSQPSSSQSNHPVPGFKPKPHPTRPGMIANKPRAMAQHLNNEHNRDSGPHSSKPVNRTLPPASRDLSSGPQPGAQGDKTRSGNVWDSLFNRPEYKKVKEPQALKKRKMVIDSEEGEEEEDYEDDLDDFIDDEGEENMENVSGAIRQLFGYDKRKYRDEDDDDRNMEVGFAEVMKEEARSARIGRKEDLEDIRREQEELRQNALKKKMRK